MNYRQKDILRTQNEELYHVIKSIEYFYNSMEKDVFTKIKNISMSIMEGKTYEQCIDMCYPEMEEYEKKYIIEETKLFDEYCNVINKNGFNFKPNMNANGFVEIDLEKIGE